MGFVGPLLGTEIDTGMIKTVVVAEVLVMAWADWLTEAGLLAVEMAAGSH